ncbi:macrophage migration inhibitory factor-like [Colias croceus]|uniref:macrophage migration inhibitory factor-like n=1 Tax=Colias crocea TaxID=72248 RepID=UPI001E27C4F6|nr:macrophage migration inhibitory factor-like [Colias croceus]
MPILKIFTNVSREKIPVDFVNKILPVLAKVLRKPENLFSCVVAPDCVLSFAGDSTIPGAMANLESIGHLGPADNKVIAKEVTDFVEKELGVSPARFVLTFYDMQPYNIAKNGVTFA